MSLSKVEIIDKVVEYVEKNGRSKDKEEECVYINSENKYCAISMMLNISDKKRKEFDKLGNGVYSLFTKGALSLDDFKEEFRVYKNPTRFYSDVQLLHDRNQNWDEDNYVTKLSHLGELEVNKLKEAYRNVGE